MAISVNQKDTPKQTKWEVVYEDEESISIWKYDSLKTSFGPVEVVYKWKRSFIPWSQKKKTIGELSKGEKNKSKRS